MLRDEAGVDTQPCASQPRASEDCFTCLAGLVLLLSAGIAEFSRCVWGLLFYRGWLLFWLAVLASWLMLVIWNSVIDRSMWRNRRRTWRGLILLPFALASIGIITVPIGHFVGRAVDARRSGGLATRAARSVWEALPLAQTQSLGPGASRGHQRLVMLQWLHDEWDPWPVSYLLDKYPSDRAWQPKDVPRPSHAAEDRPEQAPEFCNRQVDIIPPRFRARRASDLTGVILVDNYRKVIARYTDGSTTRVEKWTVYILDWPTCRVVASDEFEGSHDVSSWKLGPGENEVHEVDTMEVRDWLRGYMNK